MLKSNLSKFRWKLLRELDDPKKLICPDGKICKVESTSASKIGGTRMRAPTGVLFAAPDIHAHGGISAVIENYQQTEFWVKYNCSHFCTCKDIDRKWLR